MCIPTVIHSQAELSLRGGVRTDSYTQSGRAVTERRCAYRQLYTVRQSCQTGVRTDSYTQSGRAVRERWCAHQQLYTVRQSCQREEVCIPTVIHSQVELSDRGVLTDSYTQSGRAVRERRRAHQQLYTVRKSCQRQEACTPSYTQ